MKRSIWLFSVALFLLPSCASVKGYEKVYLNDPDMELVPASIDRFETTFQNYREAASGGDGGSTGGGCGCN